MGTQWMFLFLFPLLLCQGGLCSKDIDECQTPGICRNGGTCQNTYGGYKCVCTSGWDGDNCEHNIDDCAKAVCAGGATCIDKVASFMCLCPPGRTGLLCHLDDACLKNPCHPEATCMTNPVNGRAMCHCQPGYTGATCYEDLDECSLGGLCPKYIHGCQTPGICSNKGTCQNTYGGYKCVCVNGYDGDNCDHNIDECATASCAEGSTCIDQVGTYVCICPPGRTGGNCSKDFDECQNPGICRNGGTCQNTYGGYKCVCVNGWDGDNCDHNIDDCATAVCGEGYTCIDKVAAFMCLCPPGRTGLLCHLDDACLKNPCHPEATCMTNPISGRAICHCQPGYTGATCYKDLDECSLGPSPCEHNGQCVNTEGSFLCRCPLGYTGARCETDQNECHSNLCLKGASCQDLLDRFKRECMPEFEGVLCEREVRKKLH